MEIELRLFATYRDAVGEKVLYREFKTGETVAGVLASLETEFSGVSVLLTEENTLSPSVSVLVNGHHLSHLDGTDTVLADGDAISVMPPVTGGARGAS